MSFCVFLVQSNLDSSNTDGSFTMANSNSFLSPYEILPTAQENKYLWKFSYFIMQLYGMCTHQNRLIETILMSTRNISLFCWRSNNIAVNYRHLLPGLAPWLNLIGSNYPSLKQIPWSQRCSSHCSLTIVYEGCSKWIAYFYLETSNFKLAQKYSFHALEVLPVARNAKFQLMYSLLEGVTVRWFGHSNKVLMNGRSKCLSGLVFPPSKECFQFRKQKEITWGKVWGIRGGGGGGEAKQLLFLSSKTP